MGWNDLFQEIMKNHRGKAIGILLGLILGLFTVVLGFFKTFLVAICISIGYILGRRVDDDEDFKNWIDKILH
ncbi:MAG: DUF2273 domain-containing protein [Clostridia bacterium]|nr:DUF2273 domain-containing protein [Clostridia bacterium]